MVVSARKPKTRHSTTAVVGRHCRRVSGVFGGKLYVNHTLENINFFFYFTGFYIQIRHIGNSSFACRVVEYSSVATAGVMRHDWSDHLVINDRIAPETRRRYPRKKPRLLTEDRTHAPEHIRSDHLAMVLIPTERCCLIRNLHIKHYNV